MKKMHYFNITYACDSNCLFCAANVGIISDRNYTLTPLAFEEELIKECVKPGDIIMISGGEPTLSPYFWEILDICDKYDCMIELTTNGHFFEDANKAEKLYRYKKVNVQVSLFGLEPIHDYLTGKDGNFKSTLRALDNFASLQERKTFIVTVKFLLSKITALHNEDAYRYIYGRYRDKFTYSLNALLISEKVLRNRDLLLEPYSLSLSKMASFVELDNILVDTIPLCLLSETKRNNFLKKKHINIEKLYSDAKIQNKDMDNYQCSKCDRCSLRIVCDKFLPSYIKHFGENEINPL